MPWRYYPEAIALPDSSGEAVTLDAVLRARENRSAQQQALLQKGKPLIALTLTAMGAIKRSPLLDAIFERATARIEQRLARQFSVLERFRKITTTGHVALWTVDAKASVIKRAMIALEHASPLARLWDIDVIDTDGKPLSRIDFGEKPRQCLLCQQPAKWCARARTHSLDELQRNIEQRFRLEKTAETIGDQMRHALQAEASLTPKAGLVDKVSNASHEDMNWQLFIDSADAIAPYLTDCVKKGMTFAHQRSTPNILAAIRPIGLATERAMFATTNNVNTHKGAIFAFGILGAALGKCLAETPDDGVNIARIFDTVADIGVDLPDELLRANDTAVQTAGQRIFNQHGLLGARGEVASGFRTVSDFALPIYAREWKRDSNRQRALLITLIVLYAHNDDTNTVNRVGIDGLRAHQRWAKTILTQHEVVADEAQLIALIRRYDSECGKIRLSAGGSADLLALVIFITNYFNF